MSIKVPKMCTQKWFNTVELIHLKDTNHMWQSNSHTIKKLNKIKTASLKTPKLISIMKFKC